MARMHSRDKGRAGSVKPEQSDLSWVRYSAKEIELLVIKLAKKGLSPSQIGLRLRDEYGIPDVKELTGNTVRGILKAKNEAKGLPEDLSSLITKFVAVRKHLDKNKQDKSAKRGEQLTFSKIKRLGKYYISTGALPAEWRFDPKQAELMVE